MVKFFYLLKQEWNYASKEDRYKIALIIFLYAISNVGVVLSPLAFKGLINTLANSRETDPQQILFWFGMLFLCFLIFEIFHRSARMLEYAVGCRIRENYEDRLYRHVYSLPLSWHQDNHSGDTIDRVRLAGESLFSFIENQHSFVGIAVLSLGPFISLWFISWDLALIIGFLVVISLFINHRFDTILVPVIRGKNEKIHSFTAVLFDFVSNIETLITLGIGRLTEGVLKQKSLNVSAGYKSENRHNQVKCQVMSIMGFILEIGLLAYLIFTRRLVGEAVGIAVIIQVHQYCSLVKESTLSFSGSYFDLVKWATDFSSIDGILQTLPVRNEFSIEINREWRGLSIKNLSFHYDLSSPDQKQMKKEVFRNFSLELKNREKVAIIGASGSGKSTLFKLLRGLYTPDAVTLTVDSAEYDELSSLTSQVTLIPQIPEIFENTILYNITLGSSISRKELEAIIHAAGLEPVLERLERGPASDVRERGVNLSGGERQRIALARGLVAAKHSSVILLDEITSSIDMKTEEMIYRQIFELYSDRCIIASVHRLYLLRLFDTVFSLDKEGLPG